MILCYLSTLIILPLIGSQLLAWLTKWWEFSEWQGQSTYWPPTRIFLTFIDSYAEWASTLQVNVECCQAL